MDGERHQARKQPPATESCGCIGPTGPPKIGPGSEWATAEIKRQWRLLASIEEFEAT